MKRFMATFVAVFVLVVSAPAFGQRLVCSTDDPLITCGFDDELQVPIRWEKLSTIIRWTIPSKLKHFDSGLSGSQCIDVAPLDEVLRRDDVSKDDFIQKTTHDLEAWADSGIRFVYTDNENEADIWVGAQKLHSFLQAAVNLRVERRQGEAHAITKAAVCLNSLHPIRDVRRPMVHEFGHAIGLGHDRSKFAVMYMRPLGVSRPHQTEIELVRSLYRLRLARRD